MNGYSFSNEPGLAERLQRKSREEMKLRLLRDIRMDMAACKVEGWNPVEYIDELIELLEGLKHADNRAEN